MGWSPSKGNSMEVKIGVRSVHRELIIETDLSPEQVEEAVRQALAVDSGVFALSDTKGRRVIVPTASLGFIEIGEDENRPVGFGGTL